MIVSPHTQPESYLTSSTLSALIERAQELKRKYFACTDLGYLYSSLKTYNAAKKVNLKPILGIQFYFKDPACPIVIGTPADRCKYFTLTAYAEDQDAYQAICRLVSRTDFQTIEIREEKQNLLTWADLEYLSKYKTNIVLGGEHDLVGKAFLASDTNIGLKLFEKVNEIFPGRLRTALIAEPWSKKFARVVEIKYTDKSSDSILASDTVTTNKARQIKASDLIDRSGHFRILSKVVNGMYTEVNKDIESVKIHTGFLPLPCDATLRINKFLRALAGRYQVPVLVSDYAYYSHKEDKQVQNAVLEGKDRIAANQHMKTYEEILDYLEKVMGLTLIEADQIVDNNAKWAKLFDGFELKYELRLADSGETPALQQCMEAIQKYGRMRWSDPVWVSRLREEFLVISKNGIKDLSAYFLPIHDIIAYYEENGRLTGPGRGSSAGSLIAYLMNITKVNPFLYNLSFNRFYSVDRIKASKWADIDSDLESRDLLVGEDGKSGYLFNRWGNKAAQISTRSKMRLKSSIKDTNRYLNGFVDSEIEVLCKQLPDAGQGITDEQFLFGFEDEDGNHIDGLTETSDVLQEYIKNRPKEWAIVKKSLGITRSFSRHACAFVIADKPILNFVPVKEGCITQYEASDIESASLVKYDFLVINQLKDIRVCIDLINKKNGDNNKVGYFIHKNRLSYIWDLPEDSKVFESIWNGDTESCFQINTSTMIPFVKEIMPRNMEDLSIVLSLVRPGPLDYIVEETGRSMAKEYVYRRNSNSYEDIPVLKELIPETYSVLVYQEQITKIAKELAGFSGSAAENLREAIGKKKRSTMLKIKPEFINGCLISGKVTEDEAQQLWDRIVTFGRYAFNKSHGISYSYITYACMFLKHYYSLEFWSAVVSNADEREITGKLWPHIKNLIAPPDINLSTDTAVPDYKNNKIRAKLGIIRGIGDKTIEPIVSQRPYKNIQDFVDRDVSGPSLAHKLIHVGIMDSLFKPSMSLVEKLKAYEDAVEIKKFKEKKDKADKEFKKMRALQPKEGKIPEEYLNLTPLRDAAMKKQVLPTLPIDLYTLGSEHSQIRDPYSTKAKVIEPLSKKSVFLIDGPLVERLDKLEGIHVENDKYVAATCYIIESKEFSYDKGTKRALKLTIDCGNYISEKVLWPNYNSKEPIYPPETKKGTIATVFFKKRAGKDGGMSIISLVIES